MLVTTKDLQWILYIYCTNWLKVISCQKEINRLLVVIHRGNIHEWASLRSLKLNLECQNIKMRRRTYEHLFYSCNLFLKKQAAIIIAIHVQKALHWKLSKVVLSGRVSLKPPTTFQQTIDHPPTDHRPLTKWSPTSKKFEDQKKIEFIFDINCNFKYRVFEIIP